MPAFLHNFRLDRASFWLGFLTALLLVWLARKARPGWDVLRQWLQNRIASARRELLTTTEVRLAADTIRKASQFHLAAAYFPLENILVPPRLLAPPPEDGPEANPLEEDMTGGLLPYLPDAPELAGVFLAPTFSLAEALQTGCPLALVGRPGCGKTVALAHLAIQLARHEPDLGGLAACLPLLIHAADLELAAGSAQDPLEKLVQAVQRSAPALAQPRLPAVIQSACREGRAVLLLDGLDELPPSGFDLACAWLAALQEQYPGLRRVVSAGGRLGGLAAQGFVPLALAAWDDDERQAFLAAWRRSWPAPAAPPGPGEQAPADPWLVQGWLSAVTPGWSPLEFTLKTWAAFAGDALGPAAGQAIEAYLRRASAGLEAPRPAMEQLACQSVLTLQPFFTRRDARDWSFDDAPVLGTGEPVTGQKPARAVRPAIENPGRIVAPLIECGLLVEISDGRLRFAHPVLAGYLAGHGLGAGGVGALLGQPDWAGKALALRYLASLDLQGQWLETFLREAGDDPLQENLFQAAGYLPEAPEQAPWRNELLRRLARLVQDEGKPWVSRVRALAALVSAGAPGLAPLLRGFLTPGPDGLNQLGALGSGSLRDEKAIPDLCALLEAPLPQTQRAALLALAVIGSQAALEPVAQVLLHGSEAARRAAALALARHPEEGHSILKEAAAHEDLLVRRAAVAGLAAIRSSWAVQLIESTRSDPQWVVQNAAVQALEVLDRPNPRLPAPLPPLAETPWLVAYAGEQGVGVPPGRGAVGMALKALETGRPDQQLAALRYLSRYGELDAVPILNKMIPGLQGEAQAAAMTALWRLRLAEPA